MADWYNDWSRQQRGYHGKTISFYILSLFLSLCMKRMTPEDWSSFRLSSFVLSALRPIQVDQLYSSSISSRTPGERSTRRRERLKHVDKCSGIMPYQNARKKPKPSLNWWLCLSAGTHAHCTPLATRPWKTTSILIWMKGARNADEQDLKTKTPFDWFKREEEKTHSQPGLPGKWQREDESKRERRKS